mmetsp:Transcript_542/g.894  ORF Transcript_542/g.894 Transcript_542/m.894 type:complete len:470 (-) Transcript_542:336-1745(-)
MARRQSCCGLVQVLTALLVALVVVSLVVLRSGQGYLKSFDYASYTYASMDLPVMIINGDASSNVKSSSTPKASINIIGYAISITKCQPEDKTHRIDQAAIMLYSVHRNSIRNPASGSKYDYRAYAFVHPEAANCTSMLEQIGYEVQVLDSPVLKSEIKGTLKDYVHEASCCQEKEFLKLYSYTLVAHEVVVHLDLDCLVLQPLDDLYDSMIEGPTSPARERLALQWVKNVSDLPTNIEAFFTRDYNMVNPGVRKPHQIGVQGGFVVVKPDLDVFELYKATIIEGNYTRGPGWGGNLAYGGYYGAAQFQGLCAYFFGHIRPRKSAELNRCYYNFMADSPRETDKENPRCRTMEDECEDCRKVPFEKIKTIHFTLCAKPWWCLAEEEPDRLGGPDASPLCLAAHREWFKTRFLLEQAWSGQDEEYSTTQVFYEHLKMNISEMVTMGNCRKGPGGNWNYLPMRFPNKKIELL